MTRVHILYEYGVDHRPHGSAYIRLLNPLQHPKLAGRFQLTSGMELESADVVIVDRTWKYNVNLHEIECLLDEIDRMGAKLVYHLDDNLLDLDLANSFRPSFTLEQLACIRLLAREANSVWVSTQPLAERMRKLNPNLIVIPNALDEKLFHKRPEGQRVSSSERLTVGYMGTYTHEEDLYMILEALRQHSDRIRLELVGGLSDPNAVSGFAPLQVTILQPNTGHEYPAFARWMASTLAWDLGIAPLSSSPFTRCKSDIKFLDYSLLGIPGLYSRVDAYQNTVQHEVTGWLVENTVDAWEQSLSARIDQVAQRKTIAETAEDWVRKNRTLDVCAHIWGDAIDQLAP